MDTALEKKLAEEFPKLHKGPWVTEEGRSKAYGLFGAECGDGWYDIIREICTYLENAKSTVAVDQIKEKWGELCFYFTVIEVHPDEKDEDFFDKVDAIGSKSRHTCENCGSTEGAKIRGPGWFSCRCRSCYEQESLEKAERILQSYGKNR